MNGVAITSSSLRSGFCPKTEQERLNGYSAKLSGSLVGSYNTVLFQNTLPAAADRDKPWFRTNTDGTLDRIYTFQNGTWRSEHPIKTNSVYLWIGTLSNIETLDGGTAGTATETTGPFWKELTGIRARSPLGAGVTLEDGNVISVGTSLGAETITLVQSRLPRHKHDITGSVIAVQYGPDPHIGTTTAYKPEPASSTFATKGDFGDNAHNNMPPYYGLYFMYRTIRRYYTQS